MHGHFLRVDSFLKMRRLDTCSGEIFVCDLDNERFYESRLAIYMANYTRKVPLSGAQQ